MSDHKIDNAYKKEIHGAFIHSFLQKSIGNHIEKSALQSSEKFFSSLRPTQEVKDIIHHEMNYRLIKEISNTEELLKLGEEFIGSILDIVERKVSEEFDKLNQGEAKH